MTWKVKPTSFKAEIKEVHIKNTQAVEDYVYNYIISTAPVDTGAYRANMHRTQNYPRYDFDPAITNNVEPAPFVVGSELPVFYVSNGAPYAEVLETGHSTQAPLGIFSRAEVSARAKYGL